MLQPNQPNQNLGDASANVVTSIFGYGVQAIRSYLTLLFAYGGNLNRMITRQKRESPDENPFEFFIRGCFINGFWIVLLMGLQIFLARNAVIYNSLFIQSIMFIEIALLLVLIISVLFIHTGVNVPIQASAAAALRNKRLEESMLQVKETIQRGLGILQTILTFAIFLSQFLDLARIFTLPNGWYGIGLIAILLLVINFNPDFNLSKKGRIAGFILIVFIVTPYFFFSGYLKPFEENLYTEQEDAYAVKLLNRKLWIFGPKEGTTDADLIEAYNGACSVPVQFYAFRKLTERYSQELGFGAQTELRIIQDNRASWRKSQGLIACDYDLEVGKFVLAWLKGDAMDYLREMFKSDSPPPQSSNAGGNGREMPTLNKTNAGKLALNAQTAGTTTNWKYETEWANTTSTGDPSVGATFNNVPNERFTAVITFETIGTPKQEYSTNITYNWVTGTGRFIKWDSGNQPDKQGTVSGCVSLTSGGVQCNFQVTQGAVHGTNVNGLFRIIPQ